MANKSKSASEVLLIAVTRLGEQLLGYARNFEATENYNISSEMVIGSYFVKEFVYHAVTVSFTFDKIYISTPTLKEMGIIPTPERFVFSEGSVWRLVDRKTNSDLYILIDCHINSCTMNVAGNATIANRLSGVSKQAFDRSELS